MKVKCLYDTEENLSQKFLNDGLKKQSKLWLQINKEYVVYGIVSCNNNIIMYLTVNEYSKPLWYPDEVFEITDNKLSSFWYFLKFDEPCGFQAIWGYHELVNKENHSDNLMEREPDDLQIFYKRKKEMDLEFPDFSVKEKATIVDPNKLMCPICIDSWESVSIFGMVECPKCKKMLHNPRYNK